MQRRSVRPGKNLPVYLWQSSEHATLLSNLQSALQTLPACLRGDKAYVWAGRSRAAVARALGLTPYEAGSEGEGAPTSPRVDVNMAEEDVAAMLLDMALPLPKRAPAPCPAVCQSGSVLSLVQACAILCVSWCCLIFYLPNFLHCL